MSDTLSDAERLLATIVAARSRVAALTGDHHSTAESATPKDVLDAEPHQEPAPAASMESNLLEDDDTAEVDTPAVPPPSDSIVLGLPDPAPTIDIDDEWLAHSARTDPLTTETNPEESSVSTAVTPPPTSVDVEIEMDVEVEMDVESDEHTGIKDLEAEALDQGDMEPPLQVSMDPPEDDPFSFLDLIPPEEPKERPKGPTSESAPAIPPIRPKPVMPLVAAMASAAPPTLSKPRPVAPQILDPNRQSLEVDVVEVEEDEEESIEVLGPLPKLTENTSKDTTKVQEQPLPRTEAVFDAMTAGLQALSSGNLHKACELFSDVVDWNPDRIDARIRRGRCLRDLGDLVGAMSDFLTAEAMSPHASEPHMEMGDLFFARKDYERAIAHYSDALFRDPEHAMAHCRRGMCHHYQRRSDLALQDLQQAQAIDPEIPNIARYANMVAHKQ